MDYRVQTDPCIFYKCKNENILIVAVYGVDNVLGKEAEESLHPNIDRFKYSEMQSESGKKFKYRWTTHSHYQNRSAV